MEIIPPADDLSSFLAILPTQVAATVQKDTNGLYEVVLDLGRRPEARYLDRPAVYLSDQPVTAKDLEHATERVGQFSGDNRAGIERTLHRISALRNRSGKVIGLTCRVGRAVSGTIDIIRDLVESGKSILFLGPPGVGKTTKLREMARVLADEMSKRVIVIDTSNEIAGDGDVPHPAIGRSRRMQVSHPDAQHAVMIEAVENHTPEAIVIDEIGTEQESAAARTIAERGVVLIGTAHGNALENLLKNPTLVDLVGGIQTVTLGDDEARRRGTQKTVLERATQPTFEICIEILHTTNFDFMSWIGTYDGTLADHMASSGGNSFSGNIGNVGMFEGAPFPMTGGVPNSTAFNQLCTKTMDFQTWASTYGGGVGVWKSHYPLSDGGIYGDDSVADFNGTTSASTNTLTINSTLFGSTSAIPNGTVISGAGISGCPTTCPTVTGGTFPNYTLSANGGAVTGSMMAGNFKPAKPIASTSFNGQISGSTLTVNSVTAAASFTGSTTTSAGNGTLTVSSGTGMEVGQCVYDGGVSINNQYPICLRNGSGTSWGFFNSGNLWPNITSDATMFSTSATIVPGTWIYGAGITTPVQVIAYGTGTGLAGTYTLSNSTNGTIAAETMTSSGITSGGAIAPGAALTVDNPGLGAIYPVTVGSTVGIMQFAGAYNATLLGGTPTAIQAQVSSTPQGPPVSGCSACAWTNLSSATLSGGAWSGTIVGVPQGGPYWVSFRAANGTAYATLPNAVYEGFNIGVFGEGNDAGLFAGGFDQGNFTGFGSISGFNAATTNETNGLYVPGPTLANVVPSFAPQYLIDRFSVYGGSTAGQDAIISFINNASATSGGAPIGFVNMLKNGTGESNYFYGMIPQTQSIGIGDGSTTVFSSGAAYGGNFGASNVATVSTSQVSTGGITTAGVGSILSSATWSYLKPGTQFSCVASGCSTGPFVITAEAGPWEPALTGLGGSGLYQVSPNPSSAIPSGTSLTITHNALDFNAAYNSGATITGQIAGTPSVLTISAIPVGNVAPGLILTDAGSLGPLTVTGCLSGCGPITSASSMWSLSSNVSAIGPETMFLNPVGGPLSPSTVPEPAGVAAGGTQIPVATNGGTNGGAAPLIKAGSFEVLVNGSVVCTDTTTFSYNVIAGNCTGGSGSTAVSGWENYFTGAYSIKFTTAPASNASIVAQYTNLMSGNNSESYEQIDWFGDGTGTKTSGVLSSVSANTGGVVGALSGNNAAGGPWPLTHVTFAKKNNYIFGTRWTQLHNGVAGVYLPLGNTRGDGAQAFFGGVNTAAGGEQLGEAYFEAATQDSQFSATVGTLSGSTGAWTAVMTLTTAATGASGNFLPDFPMWEGEVLECNPYSQGCKLPVNTEIAGLCDGVNFCSAASPHPWGVSGSTYALVNITSSSSNAFSVISSAIPLHNALFYTGGVSAYAGPTNDLSMQNGFPTNGYAVEGGTGGITGPMRLGHRAGLISGAALSGNPNNAMTPTLSRVLPSSNPCDAAATTSPCLDIGTATTHFPATASATWSGSTFTITGGLSAGGRPFVPGMALSCSGCNSGLFALAVSLPPTQSTTAGAGQISQTFTVTASGTIGGGGTGTLTGGCKGTSGTGSNCIDFNFDINTTGTYGTTASLNTCSGQTLVGTNTNTLTSGTILYPNGFCNPTGVGALVRGFRIGTNQLMDVPFDQIIGSAYDNGADPGGGSGLTVQDSAFTCNIVAATEVQCVIAPNWTNGVPALGVWSSNSIFASYGDPFASSSFISGIVGPVGGQSLPFTAGSGYPASSSWTTGGICTLTTGAFTSAAPGISFQVNSSGAIVDAYPSRLGNGIDAACTFPLSFTGFTGVISAWGTGVNAGTNNATIVISGITTQGTIVPGETISGSGIPAGSTIVPFSTASPSTNGTYKINCATSCNVASETMTSGPTTGSGGAITALPIGGFDGLGHIESNDEDTNIMGDYLYDNSCVAGNPNGGACSIPSGGLESPGLAARPFGTRRGVEVGG